MTYSMSGDSGIAMALNGSSSPAEVHCIATDCKESPFTGTPLCFKHLSGIGVNPKGSIKAGSSSSVGDSGQHAAATPATTRTVLPAKNGVLARSPYLRRKTAPGIQKPHLSPTAPAASAAASAVATARSLSAEQTKAGRDGTLSSTLSDSLSLRMATRQQQANGDGLASTPRTRRRKIMSEGGDSGLGSGEGSQPCDSSDDENEAGADEEGKHDGGERRRAKEQRQPDSRPLAQSKSLDSLQSRGWWDVENRRRDRERVRAVDEVPIPSTPLRLSSLYRRGDSSTRSYSADRRHRPLHVPVVPRFSLDAFVYSQEGAGAAPPGVKVPSKAEMVAAQAVARMNVAAEAAEAAATTTAGTDAPSASSSPFQPQPAYIHAHIDPRVHWMRPRSNSWHAAKQVEIRARGGRKANFGKAAARLAEQRRRNQQTRTGGSGSGNGNGNGNGNGTPNGANGFTRSHGTAGKGVIGSKRANGSGGKKGANGNTNGNTSGEEGEEGHANGHVGDGSSPVVSELPSEQQTNKQWSKFTGIFAQHSEERRLKKKQALDRAGLR